MAWRALDHHRAPLNDVKRAGKGSAAKAGLRLQIGRLDQLTPVLLAVLPHAAQFRPAGSYKLFAMGKKRRPTGPLKVCGERGELGKQLSPFGQVYSVVIGCKEPYKYKSLDPPRFDRRETQGLDCRRRISFELGRAFWRLTVFVHDSGQMRSVGRLCCENGSPWSGNWLMLMTGRGGSLLTSLQSRLNPASITQLLGITS